ncbi:MAG: glycosyltransferase family 1 protein [Gemmatimonadaceae bacterium]
MSEKSDIVFVCDGSAPGGIGRYARGLGGELLRQPAGRLRPSILDTSLGPGGRRVIRPLRRVYREQVGTARELTSARLVHLADYRPVVPSHRAFVLTVHDVFFLTRPDWYPRPIRLYKKALLHVALRKHPAAVICVSQATREALVAAVPGFAGIRLEVIHPGVEPPRSPAEATPAGDTYFVTVGTIEPRRNHLALLEAFRRARGEGLQARWRVVGGVGYHGAPIADELRAADGVDVVTGATDEELDATYRGALFAVTPSLGEGFGFPPLEAMARGVPVICPAGGVFDETVGDAGVRVAGSADSWTDALLHLGHRADERSRYAAAGARQAGTFSWDRAAAATTRLYEEILGVA